MTNDKPTDYAAIICAAQTPLPEPPDWLRVGKHIYSSEHGIGEVMAMLGKRLIVRFLEDITPTQFSDWPSAVAEGQILASNNVLAVAHTPLSEVVGDNPRVSQEDIQAIPNLAFRAIAQELSPSLVAVDITQGNAGVVYSLPKDLPSELRSGLNRIGIKSLYSHQVEALDFLRAGLDISISTQTASGKTLCYNLAILESCLKEPKTTALYIFPLKALALDQMRKLHLLTMAFPSDTHIKVGLMTGDTPKEERQRLFIPNPPNILAVSPDLLHHHLYYVRSNRDYEPWRQFLRCLRWVVIDESHTYVGAFGAHFANVMRRLRLAVDRVGGNSNKLQFICTSATIGNPQEMALRFSGRTDQSQRLRLIKRSGASSAGRTLLCLTPSSAANPDACKIIISWLQHDRSGIVFCNSRAAVKSLLGLIQRETQRQGVGYLATKVAVFYGSIKGDRRQEIINQLQQGSIKVILSTSALECGIDLPELDCCLLRGFPGSLMSFWQRVGRAGRSNHGLVIFLPLASDPLDAFYARNPEQLLSGEVEKAAFNADYATILSKHLSCGCVESGLPLGEVQNRFGAAAGAIADSLLQQNKLVLSRDGKLWGIRGMGENGYPHKNLNLRSSAQNSIELIDKHSGEVFEQMPLPLAHREVFPGAIYTVQDALGELIAYRSESLDQEHHQAVLEFLGKDTDLFTQAESELHIQPLSKLAEPRIISTTILEGRLRLTLAWAEITTLVTGYKLLTREYGQTCKNEKCPNYRCSLQGKTCPSCKRPLKSAEVTKVKEEIQFEQPYRTHYQAPVVKIEINPPLIAALQTQMSKIKEHLRAGHDNNIPEQFKDLWTHSPEFIALHSMEHQLIKAVPLVILSSSLDVDAFIDNPQGRTIGWLFDSCDGGTGTAEALFQNLPKFAAKARALALSCDCSSGCPRCLTQHGCPQENTGLHKDAGLILLDAIGQRNETDDF